MPSRPALPPAAHVAGADADVPRRRVASASPLLSAAADWNLPQAVTVTGVDDDLHDGDRVYSIVVAPVTSGDAFYHGLPVPDVGVTNLDDDLGWHNRLSPCDVNGDGAVTALDVLIVINYINGRGSAPSLPPPSVSPPPYYDVNDDGLCTAGDVSAVINFINQNRALPFASGEDSADSRDGSLLGRRRLKHVVRRDHRSLFAWGRTDVKRRG